MGIQPTEEPVSWKPVKHKADLHSPICTVFGVVQRGLDAAVRLHVLVHLWGHEGPRILIGEGLALAVGALWAQVGAVCHLILLHGWKQERAKPRSIQIDTHWSGMNRKEMLSTQNGILTPSPFQHLSHPCLTHTHAHAHTNKHWKSQSSKNQVQKPAEGTNWYIRMWRKLLCFQNKP